MTSPEGSGAFGGFIGPRTLAAAVESTAPWLFGDSTAPAAPHGARLAELGAGPHGWWRILRAADRLAAAEKPTARERSDYFALCLASHFASAATFVPTDVDTKIRHALWQDAVGTEELPRMRALALGLADWDLALVSARNVEVEGIGRVSGHDGERLSVLCGGLVAALRARDEPGAAELEAAVDAELAREARAFAALERARGAELDLLRLASVLTHNAGDVLQGLAGAGNSELAAPLQARFGELARERFERYGGSSGRAAALYRALPAKEGHRNYPLRKPRALRRSPALLLPIAPLFDSWGETLARTPLLDDAERAEIVEALVLGIQKVPGQSAYARALAGFQREFPRGLESPELAPHQSASTRRLLRSAELRKAVAVTRGAFESSLRKRAREVLAAR